MQPISSVSQQVMVSDANQTTSSLSELDVQKQKLRDATRDFEAIFVRQLLSSMQATLMDGGMYGEDTAGAIYSDLMNTAIADNVAENGSIGLSDILYQRMVQRIDPGGAGDVDDRRGTAIKEYERL